MVVHREVRSAAAELEEFLTRGAVTLVLLHGVLDRLFSEAVLQLERGNRQAIDEQAEIKCALSLITAVAELACNREAVLGVAFSGGRVAGRRRAIEEFDVMRPILDPLAEHVDDSAPADFALETGQELPACWTPFVQPQRPGGLRLRGLQEYRELDPIDTKLAAVVLGIAADPARSSVAASRFRDVAFSRRIARTTGERRADQAFEAKFAGVGGHVNTTSVLFKWRSPSTPLAPYRLPQR